MSDYNLSTEDDTLHTPPEGADTWWTETFWFTFAVPECKLFGNFYLYFRPLLNSIGGGVTLFDDTGTTPWETPFYSMQHHLPIPAGLDMRDARLPGGLFVRQREPNKSFAFGISNDEIDVDLQFDAIAPALVTAPKPRPPFTGAYHVDQAGRVTGTITLRAQPMEVNCILMRDRSWGRRSDLRGVKAGYDYAFPSVDDGFLGLSLDRGEDRVVMGFIWRDGVWSKAVSGERRVHRKDNGMPAAIDIEVIDELGRSAVAHGEVVSQFTNLVYPSMLVHQSLVEWSYAGATVYAEDQDVWDPAQWRAFRREGVLPSAPRKENR
ncbi:hypothetical protein H7J88_22355 [Mycolicibacterium flavescens]|uniref:Uncharacterized protein n=1 Tax=Mycolicibacterium flavescens TaxID=1776 RepID=A0A1E3RDG3_MYCFV|nr:hypothetical protein [Mycolicibacterium flavescens]MCV7282378.1 hypothetical protein [Mycolicibacterium flavescens]ODQ87903.1 hypothetical protein BHQ18_21595 [Mycolicibacterium flavescens]